MSARLFYGSIRCSNRYEASLHLKHFSDWRLQSHRDLVRKQHGRICCTTLDGHDGLTADAYAKSKFFLCHAAFKAEAEKPQDDPKTEKPQTPKPEGEKK